MLASLFFFIIYTVRPITDILVLDVPQGTVKKLTSKPGEYSELQWSPDSKQIAFTSGNFSDKKLYTIAVDKLKLTELASQLPLSRIESLTWSLDSQQIAFIKEEKTNEQLGEQSIMYVINRDGSKLMKLSNSGDVFLSSPTWQP
jgi:Tol biopolymer transport system component